MCEYPCHEDLGLVDDDWTEDLRRPRNVDAAGVAAPTASEPTAQQETEKGKSVSTVTRGACKHCTVPTDGADVCGFCATYTPPSTPAQKIDVIVNRVDIIRADANVILRAMPTTTPLFSVVDLVRALQHLRMAALLLDGVSDALESAKVQR